MKQGGVLSGALFNFFIDDLIEECYQSGVGAIFIDIIVPILVFYDDICLLSPDKEGMSKKKLRVSLKKIKFNEI